MSVVTEIAPLFELGPLPGASYITEPVPLKLPMVTELVPLSEASCITELAPLKLPESTEPVPLFLSLSQISELVPLLGNNWYVD